MKNTKHKIAQFTFYDRTGIQSLLEAEAQKGWMLEKMSTFSWKFRRIEPAKIHFAVTYFPKASGFDPEPSEEQQRFWEFCEHTGWKLAAHNAHLQIFYNEQENPVPIETDPQIELENIQKIAYKSIIPSYSIIFILAVLSLCLQLMMYIGDPISYLSRNSSLIGILCWLALMTMSALEVGGFLLWQSKAQKAIMTDGSFVKTFGFRKIELGLMWFIIVLYVVYLMTQHKQSGTIILLSTFIAAMPAFAVALFRNILKKLGVSAGINKILTIVFTVILCFGGTAAAIIGVTNWVMASDLFDREPRYTYEYRGHTFKVYDDELPLMVQDMVETDYDGYSTSWYGDESVFMSEYDAYQHPKVGDFNQYSLQYTLVEIKMPFLYNMVFNHMLKDFPNNRGITEDDPFYERAVEIPASEWGAQKAYQLYIGADYPDNEYLLCYEDAIIVLRPDMEMELTKEAKAAVAEKIGGVVVCYN